MKQISITLGDLSLPVIVDKGNEYYPVSTISYNILKRNSSIISKNKKGVYETKLYNIDYSYCNGGVQQVNCINRTYLIEILNSLRLGAMSSEQRNNLNYLREYFGLDKVSDDERIINKYDYIHYNEFIQDAIKEVFDEDENIKWQLCSKCNNYYPFHEIFFKYNTSGKCLYSYCNECNNDIGFSISDRDLKSKYYRYGLESYIYNKNHDTIKIYEDYILSGKVSFPQEIRNKEDYLRIIDHLIKEGRIDKYKLNITDLLNKFKLRSLSKICDVDDIYTHLFGDNYYLYPWRYQTKIFKYKEITNDIINKIFNNYLFEHKCEIRDIFAFDYSIIIRSCRLIHYVNDIKYFAVQYNKFKYPGYMFKMPSSNYYKNDENLLFDLKYLIENDMMLDINKIPLYLTKSNLHKKANSLYHHIVSKKNGSLYHWVNKLYPNKFIEADFDVNPYRNEFDSDKEMYIHEILKEKFNNVIYNKRNTEITIDIIGMVPDWLVFTDNGVWIIEYFGMYDKGHSDNSRVSYYINKTHDKLNKYESVNGYNKLYLYPEDTYDDFLGCRNKLEQIE